MNEVDPDAAHRDAEPREPAERLLLGRPVESVRPVGDEFAKVVHIGPQRPPGILGRVRPSRRPQARPEILERGGSGLRGEWLRTGHGVRHGRHPTGRAAPPAAFAGRPARPGPAALPAEFAAVFAQNSARSRGSRVVGAGPAQPEERGPGATVCLSAITFIPVLFRHLEHPAASAAAHPRPSPGPALPAGCRARSADGAIAKTSVARGSSSAIVSNVALKQQHDGMYDTLYEPL